MKHALIIIKNKGEKLIMTKKWVTATMQTDLKTYEAFRCCNTLNQDMLNKMGMSDKRINNHVKDKLIEKVDLFNKKDGTSSTIYKSTDKGKNFMANKLNVSSKGWYSSSSERHDMGVAKLYMDLTDKQKASCITESEVRDMMKSHIRELMNEGKEMLREGDSRGQELTNRANELNERLEDHSISPPDLIFVNDAGHMESLEVTTDAYGNQAIEAKIDFCTELSIEVQLYKI